MKVRVFIFFILISFLLAAGCVGPSGPVTPLPTSTPFKPEEKMTVHFIDVGEGDSELIESPAGMIMLIDAGPPESGTKVARYLKDQGISLIDTLVISNPHDDHIGGLPAVIEGFSIKQVIDGGFENSSGSYDRLIATIRQRNIAIREVSEGETIDFDPEVSVQVLNPPLNRSVDINQNSVVLKITFDKDSFLFTSDAGGEAEMRYAKAAGHINVLKVADHGSENSTSSEFLSLIMPTDGVIDGVIEVGAGNPFGYPSESTLSRVKGGYRRTDISGTIKFVSDGYTSHVEGEKMCNETPLPGPPDYRGGIVTHCSP